MKKFQVVEEFWKDKYCTKRKKMYTEQELLIFMKNRMSRDIELFDYSCGLNFNEWKDTNKRFLSLLSDNFSNQKGIRLKVKIHNKSDYYCLLYLMSEARFSQYLYRTNA